MPSVQQLFRCVGQAVVAKGLRGLAEAIPFGEVLYDVATDAYERLQQGKPEVQLRADMEVAVRAPAPEVRKAAAEVAAEVAAGQSEVIRQRLTAYLAQLPNVARQSLRRRDDPTGTTVPPAFALRGPEDLLSLLPARLPRFRSGDRLPGAADWVLVDLLGVGGFGEVWKVRHATFEATVAAVKFCLDPAARDRLLRHEGAVLNQVMQQGKHPGIVPLLDAKLDGDTPWLKYEYVAGGDLAALACEWQQLAGPERAGRAVGVVHQLAMIVGHFHRLSPPVVHRDLKPANVLVQPGAGGSFHLHIADFGIGAVAAAPSLIAAGYGATGTSRGDQLATALRGAYTPLYASPQQKRGEKADVRDDVYALGVI